MRLLWAGGGSVRRRRGEYDRRLPLQLWLRRLLGVLVRLRRGGLHLRLRHLLTPIETRAEFRSSPRVR